MQRHCRRRHLFSSFRRCLICFLPLPFGVPRAYLFDPNLVRGMRRFTRPQLSCKAKTRGRFLANGWFSKKYRSAVSRDCRYTHIIVVVAEHCVKRSMYAYAFIQRNTFVISRRRVAWGFVDKAKACACLSVEVSVYMVYALMYLQMCVMHAARVHERAQMLMRVFRDLQRGRIPLSFGAVLSERASDMVEVRLRMQCSYA